MTNFFKCFKLLRKKESRVSLYKTGYFCIDYETAHKHKANCHLTERSSFTIKIISKTSLSKNLYRIESSQNLR